MNASDFVINRIKSVKFAYIGMYKLITTEHSIMIQACIGIIAIVAGYFFNITKLEWMIQLLAIAMVMSIEGMNTAVEKIADFIHPEYHEKIGFIKDISAGAVFIVAILSLIVGVMIYYPYVYAIL
jgi:diacylglycerol kinase (ATP)